VGGKKGKKEKKFLIRIRKNNNYYVGHKKDIHSNFFNQYWILKPATDNTDLFEDYIFFFKLFKIEFQP